MNDDQVFPISVFPILSQCNIVTFLFEGQNAGCLLQQSLARLSDLGQLDSKSTGFKCLWEKYWVELLPLDLEY